MLAKEFIFEKLTTLAQQFPGVTIKYDFDSMIKTHIVELSPISEYYNNDLLTDNWIEIAKEFLEKFPTEDISFISTDSILKVTNPEFTLNTSQSIHFSDLQRAFLDLIPAYSSNIDLSKIIIPNELVFQSHPEIRVFGSIASYAFSNLFEVDLVPLLTEGLPDIQNPGIALPNEFTVASNKDHTYAMAA